MRAQNALRSFAAAIACSLLLPVSARADIVDLLFIDRPGLPNYSQFPTAYSPAPAHASLWWRDAAQTYTMLCGPTSAANSAVWLAAQPLPAEMHAARLGQVWNGTAWVAPTNPSVLIEEFAGLMGSHRGWSWSGTTGFPGTQAGDLDFMAGIVDYFLAREVSPVIQRFLPGASLFNQIVDALKAGADVELSTTTHWFSVAGARTQFEDVNGNKKLDPAEAGSVKTYLDIHDPGQANSGWKTYYADGSDFKVQGFDGILDSAVTEVVVPEPAAILLLGSILVVLAAWLRRRPAQGGDPTR